MKPALHFLSLYLDSYSLMMLLGFVGAWLLARKRASAYGIPPKNLDNISLLMPIAGLFGARLFARLFYAKLPLIEALKVWEGDGLVFYGGFLLCIAVVVIYALVRNVNLVSLMDCLAPSVAVGLAFGRVGCFLGGCCWGDLCVAPAQLAPIHDSVVVHQVYTFPAISSAAWPLAVSFPHGSEIFRQHVKLGLISPEALRSLPVHPVQLYEAALAALLAFGVHRLTRKPGRPGNASLSLLFGYAAIRFATEFLRADNKLYGWHMTFSQVVSVYITLTCIAVLALRSMYARNRKLMPASTVMNPELIHH